MKAVNDAHFLEYGVNPDVVAKAPGRFHLIGEHSWFFKDKTLSMAINMPVYVAVSKRNDSNLRFCFNQINERKRATLSNLKIKKEDRWANTLKAIVFGYLSTLKDYSVTGNGDKQNCGLSGMDVTVFSEILPSAGFGITTAIKAAYTIAIKALFQIPFSDAQILQVIERANRKFLMVNNYLADNYTALFARKDNLLITDYTKNTWDYVPYHQSFTENKKIFLVDTKVPRVSLWKEETLFEPENALLLGDLKERKNNIYGDWHYISNVTDINEELSVVSENVRRKLLCVMREHGDVLDAVEGLTKGDFYKFARAVNHSHESMRDMYELSCPEIDWILKRVNELEPNLQMITNPVSCGRITGKGFGRCLYAIIRNSDEDRFKEKLTEFEKIFGYHTACFEINTALSEGATII
ncbi:MAG: galactokinase [Treponema sp.]|nr:galactokinase [Treponema sp.]